MRFLLSLIFLSVSLLSFSQWPIPDSYLETLTDTEGNTHNIEDYIYSGKPVFVLDIVQWDSNSWTIHEEGHLIDLYNQYGQGGSNDVVVLYVAGFGFESESDLSGIDYSEELGTGYDEVSFVDNNPVPIIVAADNDGFELEFEESQVSTMCFPGNYRPITEITDVEDMMDEARTHCCSDLETFDPLLGPDMYFYGPDCDPTLVNYVLVNHTMTSFSSCNIDIYINNIFEEQIEITEYLNGCSSTQMIYENPAIHEGDEVTLAVASENDQLSNDTVHFQTQEVDTLGSRIKIEMINPASEYNYVNAEIGDLEAHVNDVMNWYDYMFVEPGCDEFTLVTIENVVSDQDSILIGSVDEFGNYTDTLVYEDFSEFAYSLTDFTVFIEDPAAPPHIWGYVFEDIDDSQYFNPNFPRIQGIQVDHGSQTTFTNEEGYYSFNSVEAGENTTISYDEMTWAILTTPNSGNYELDHFYHCFGLNNNDPVWELSSYIDLGLPYLCENEIHQTIHIHNTGNQPATGQVVFTYDPMLTPLEFEPAPTEVNGNTVTFNIPTVQNGGYLLISADYEGLPADSLGQLIDAELEIITFDEDSIVTATSTDAVSDTLFCSYDPNDIYGFPLGAGPEGFIEPDTDLKYRIRFQNTGNFPATNVVVRDTLPEELNWESFEPGASSHNYSVTLDEETREIVWTFNNIMLPDSTSDPEGSNGFVWYHIEMNELVEGDQILNTSYIYFDQNEAIITNTSLHTIDPSISVNEVKKVDFHVYPNPASAEVRVSGNFEPGEVLQLRDIQGRLIHEIKIDSNSFKIATDQYEPGIYLLNLKNASSSVKLVITH